MLSEDDVSDKVIRLGNILDGHRRALGSANGTQARFQAIIFVQRRHLGRSLAGLLPRLGSLSTWVTSRSLLGHGGQAYPGGVQSGQLFKDQERIVAEFRKGSFNILVATSVAEEGLGFLSCDLVVRFDSS